MGKSQVIVVENHQPTATSIKQALSQRHHVRFCHTLNTLLEGVLDDPTCVIIGRDLPKGTDVPSLCIDLKSKHPDIPIILVCERVNTSTAINLLTHGIDDYVSTPFNWHELEARVSRLCRLNARKATIGIGSKVELCTNSMALAFTSGEVEYLSKREFDILHHMAKSPGRVFSRGQLSSKVSSPIREASETAIDVHICRIREKLGENAATHLQTVYGAGYCLRI